MHHTLVAASFSLRRGSMTTLQCSYASLHGEAFTQAKACGYLYSMTCLAQ
jgi:hypothetical protein